MNNDMNRCTNQVMLFFRYLDERQYDALAALLAPDAVWHRQGKVLKGPTEVQTALTQRSATMRIAHIMTNLACDDYDVENCTIRGYMLVVRHEPGAEISGPSPLEGIESIRTMHIRLRRDGHQWLITELKGDDIMFAAPEEMKR